MKPETDIAERWFATAISSYLRHADAMEMGMIVVRNICNWGTSEF